MGENQDTSPMADRYGTRQPPTGHPGQPGNQHKHHTQHREEKNRLGFIAQCLVWIEVVQRILIASLSCGTLQ